MEIKEYKEAVRRTANTTVEPQLMFCNIALGINGEAREALREVHAFEVSAGNRSMLVKELGDFLWYTVWAYLSYELPLEEDFNTAAALCVRAVQHPRRLVVRDLNSDVDEAVLNYTEHVKKVIFHGLPLDLQYLRVQLGSLLVAIHTAARLNDITMDEVMTANVNKLLKRYPKGFNSKVYANNGSATGHDSAMG